MNDWKSQAEALFFTEHLGITVISQILIKSRETVSRYLNSCEGYENEMEFRKQSGIKQRKEYQKNWDRQNRHKYNSVDGNTLKTEHEIAVKILSSENYF